MRYIDNFGRLASYELMHYGVEGMHWGIRRYQPYSNGYKGDGKFTGNRQSKAPKKNVSNSSVRKSEGKRRTVSPKVKKALKIGASIAGTVLLSYGMYKFATSPKMKAMARKGLDIFNKRPSADEMIANSWPQIVRKANKAIQKPRRQPVSTEYLESLAKQRRDLIDILDRAKARPVSTSRSTVRSSGEAMRDLYKQNQSILDELYKRTLR